ncbi:MAG: hypothetical protein ACOYM3_12155 [Terrimicrobiaceae bacterium]
MNVFCFCLTVKNDPQQFLHPNLLLDGLSTPADEGSHLGVRGEIAVGLQRVLPV